MRRYLAIVLLLCALGARPAPARADAPPNDRAVVAQVIDGDTVRVRLDGRAVTVRLIGVDTPELHDRHDRSAPPQPFAREAAAFVRAALGGRVVRLEYEPAERLDRYGRTLAYVLLPDGTCFNRELVRQGYARAYTRFPFRWRAQFVADEQAARAAGRGLWAEANAAAASSGAVIGNRRSRLYHRRGQRHYAEIAPANRVYFASEAEARAAGYTPARE
ncbi:MAG: thermonuclease family protein [Deltaproteobacteria bacterium]|nr:thermonuclease family protein [Deltaproteobacteria bacterium]